MAGGSLKKCDVCKKSISKSVLKLQCGICKRFFHLECEKVSEVDARLMAAEKRAWKCGSCRTPSASPLSTLSSLAGRRSILMSQPISDQSDAIAELRSLVRQLQEENKEIIRSFDFLSGQWEEERKRSKVLEDMVGDLSKENQVLRRDVDRLQLSLNKEESKKLVNNLSITGLITENDSKEQAVEKTLALFSFLDTPISSNDVAHFKQVPTKSGVKIIATLKPEHKKQILATRSKKGKLTLRNTKFGDSDARIFVDEELTKETYHLFKHSKQLKGVGYKYVWHREGKILARKNDDSDIIFIRNASHVNDLLK